MLCCAGMPPQAVYQGALLLPPPLPPPPAAMTGEFALAAPMVGISQSLVNKDHHQVYYADMPLLPGGR